MFDLLNKIINSASKKNFLETNCILLKFLGLENAFKPACVSPIFLSKKNMLRIKQIILPIKNLAI